MGARRVQEQVCRVVVVVTLVVLPPALGCETPVRGPRIGDAGGGDTAMLASDARECDRDRDGHDAIVCGGDDCDDDDRNAAPGLVEVCDAAGRDEDCQPETLGDVDADGDGAVDSECCNDVGADRRCGRDCDDARASRSPDSEEVCDRIDNDCDSRTDEGVTRTYYRDADGDLHGDADDFSEACVAADEYRATVADDCDDTDPRAHGGATEICDLTDNDCDARTDEGATAVDWYLDVDGDGFGSAEPPLRSCAPVEGRVLMPTDCDDARRNVSPGGTEVCNGRDDDCSGTIDDMLAASSCALAGAVEHACIAGACRVLTCALGLGDCDGVAATGCETDVTTHLDHCGTCGNACADPFGADVCIAGACDVTSCATGFHACDGACAANTSPTSCGASCVPCAAPRSDGAATCDGTSCGMACASAAFVLVGSGVSADCLWASPALADLAPSRGSLQPAFDAATTTYQLDVGDSVSDVSFLPRLPAGATASVRVDGVTVTPGASSAARPLPLGASVVDVVVTAESGAARTYTVAVRRGFFFSSYLKSSNTGAGDRFGTAVALDGDTLVVGAPLEDSAATGVNGNQANDAAPDSGAVYVFRRTPSGWAQEAYLKANNAGASDQFGCSVAIDGDTLVVGALFEDSAATGVNGDGASNTGSNSGAAYVFVRTGSVWAQEAYLKASNTDVNDGFGGTVAVSDDTVVVGAWSEDGGGRGVGADGTSNTAPDSGAVYVFRRVGGAWAQEAYLKASNADAGDVFAYVAIDGDTLVVGAPYEDSAATGVGGDSSGNANLENGAAYVFARSGSAWSEVAYLKNTTNGGNAMFFGRGVVIDGSTIVVGAFGHDGEATGVGGDEYSRAAMSSGAAWVFVRSGTSWTPQAYLKASNTGAGDELGAYVDISGDTIVVGAAFEDGSARGVGGGSDELASNSGAAYVYRRTGTTWAIHEYLKASNTGAVDRFAQVAISGDLIIVGASHEDSADVGIGGDGADDDAIDSGALYVFQR